MKRASFVVKLCKQNEYEFEAVEQALAGGKIAGNKVKTELKEA